MSQNPYQPSVTGGRAVGVNSGSREDLRSVAQYQKGVLICILVYIILVVGQFAIPSEARPWVVLPLLIILGLTSTVFVFLMAMKVYSTGQGALMAILTLVPCVGLFVLLIINGKATGVLKQNGIRVGLLGAKLSDI